MDQDRNPPPSAIPDRDLDALIPLRGRGLSPFAKLAWVVIAVTLVASGWAGWSKLEMSQKNYARLAREAVNAKDWPAALDAIHRVQGKTREKPEFLRTLADYLEGTRTEPELLADVLERLHSAGASLDADGIWLARAHLSQGKPAAARSALGRATQNLSDSLDYLETESVLLRKEGRKREALEVEKRIFSLHGHNPRIAVRKALSELSGTFPEIRQAALKRLWGIAANTDENGMVAVRALTSLPDLTAQEAEQLLYLSNLHKDCPIEARLNIISRLVKLDHSRRKQLIEAEIIRLQSVSGRRFQALIAWLAREREFGRILTLMPKEDLYNSKELFPSVAQDLAQREQWQELQELLQKGRPLPVSNARAAVWRALASHRMIPDDLRQARTHLEEAIHESVVKRDAEALAGALALAEEWGMLDLALDASKKLAVPGSRNETTMLEQCWKLASALKKEASMADVAERMVTLQPDNSLFVRRHAYLRLLRGKEMELFEVKDGEGSAGDASLLLRALQAYRLQNLDLAATMLEQIQNTSDLSTGENAVYAGLLARVLGDASRAYLLAERIRPELLLAEEKTFLGMAL